VLCYTVRSSSQSVGADIYPTVWWAVRVSSVIRAIRAISVIRIIRVISVIRVIRVIRVMETGAVFRCSISHILWKSASPQLHKTRFL
jgi:hypothetical protein